MNLPDELGVSGARAEPIPTTMNSVSGQGRKQHGGFQRPEELMNVKGIGEKSYAKLKPYLALTSSPRSAAAAK